MLVPIYSNISYYMLCYTNLLPTPIVDSNLGLGLGLGLGPLLADGSAANLGGKVVVAGAIAVRHATRVQDINLVHVKGMPALGFPLVVDGAAAAARLARDANGANRALIHRGAKRVVEHGAAHAHSAIGVDAVHLGAAREARGDMLDAVAAGVGGAVGVASRRRGDVESRGEKREDAPAARVPGFELRGKLFALQHRVPGYTDDERARRRGGASGGEAQEQHRPVEEKLMAGVQVVKGAAQDDGLVALVRLVSFVWRASRRRDADAARHRHDLALPNDLPALCECEVRPQQLVARFAARVVDGIPRARHRRREPSQVQHRRAGPSVRSAVVCAARLVGPAAGVVDQHDAGVDAAGGRGAHVGVDAPFGAQRGEERVDAREEGLRGAPADDGRCWLAAPPGEDGGGDGDDEEDGPPAR